MYTGSLDAVSNKADWQFVREIIDDDTGEPIDLSAASITLDVFAQSDDQTISTATATTPILTASTTLGGGNGKITILDTGVFQAWFTPSDMQALCAGYFDARCRITANGVTTTLMAATLPVVDG